MRRPALALALALGAASCGPAAAPERDAPAPAPRPAPPPPQPAAAPDPKPLAEAPPVSDATLRARLRAAFGGYETAPERRELEGLAGAERLVPALIELAGDRGEPPHKRSNALASLRFFAGVPGARAELEARAGDPAAPRYLRRTAARALAAAYGDDALATLGPLLGDPDPDLRDAAVRALGALGSVRSRALLEGRASVEADPNVRLSLRRALPQR
ncbi:MAG TPA: HEAT repeat domain-containing protein [Polyangiaceae bacterium]|nr:HEAT repeat domain-containing protein [Polyangiaceae bacterium]